MMKLSPRFLLSPRFFALPLAAVVVIVALAASHRNMPVVAELSSPVVRANTCATPGKALDATCVIARDLTRVVR